MSVDRDKVTLSVTSPENGVATEEIAGRLWLGRDRDRLQRPLPARHPRRDRRRHGRGPPRRRRGADAAARERQVERALRPHADAGLMICRLWRGWTTPENADDYERIVRDEVIPGIEARNIPGFRHIDLMRRDLGGEIEFQTFMWFDSLDAIKAFMGEDYSVSHVPAGGARRAQQLRRSRGPFRGHRPPRAIAANRARARQPPRPHRFPLLRLGADRARAGLRPAVRRERRGQDQPARSGVAADARPRPARRGAVGNGAAGRRAAAWRSRRRLGDDRDRHRHARRPRPSAGRCGSTARRRRSTRSANGCRCCG